MVLRSAADGPPPPSPRTREGFASQKFPYAARQRRYRTFIPASLTPRPLWRSRLHERLAVLSRMWDGSPRRQRCACADGGNRRALSALGIYIQGLAALRVPLGRPHPTTCMTRSRHAGFVDCGIRSSGISATLLEVMQAARTLPAHSQAHRCRHVVEEYRSPSVDTS